MNESGWKRAGGYGLALLLLWACGSDDGGASSTAPKTQAGSDTPFSNVGAGDRAELCDWYVDGTDYDAVCEYLAVAFVADGDRTGTLADCQEVRTTCLDGATASKTAAKEACREEWFATDCTAPLEDVLDCLSSMQTNGPPAYASVGTCETADYTQPVDSSAIASVFSGCSAVISTCPSLFAGGGSGVNTPTSEVPVIQACEATCARFVSSCELEACPDDCAINRSVYGEACDAIGEAFFACAESASFDCTETEDLMLAVDGCNNERADYVTCYGLGGVTCDRQETYDEVCAGKDATHPYGKRCVSAAAPSDCVLSSSAFYCCASL